MERSLDKQCVGDGIDGMNDGSILKYISAGVGASEIVDILRADGVVVVEDLFDPVLIGRLCDELEPTVRDTRPGPSVAGGENEEFWGRNTIRFASLAALSDAFIDVLLTPVVHEIAAGLMKDVCQDYWMNTAQFIGIGPGEPVQALHRDNDLWQRVVELTWPNTPELSFNSIIPLHDVSEELGATRVVPGSNQWPDLNREARADESVPAEMALGSALLYSGHTLHGGGANQTIDGWRYAIQMSFNAGWLTPEEAHPFAISAERARMLPRKAQRLLGYRSYLPGGAEGYDRLWVKDYEDIGKHAD